jgi:Uma2 family endonuclease
MDRAERAGGKVWTAEEFLEADQHEFGDAWRYELVDGRIIAHAAPSPDHGAIISSLVTALYSRLRGRQDGCRTEVGSGAVPEGQQRNTARIPDVMIRCATLPRVVFEIISPSELRNRRERDRKRRDEQEVEGVQEIAELFQDEAAAHIYRREEGGTWSFELVEGLDAALRLRSVDLEIPMAEVYETVRLRPDAEGSEPS